MSVSDLERYLLWDEIEAGEKLLTQKEYRDSVHRIARRLLYKSFPQYLDDAIQEAELHTLEKVRQHGFLANLFRNTFVEYGGVLSNNENSACEIIEIPPVILEQISQPSPQTIPVPTGRFCFHQATSVTAQITVLDCNHPLRISVIRLALGSAGVCDATLAAFHRWHRTVAKRRMIDCLRRYQAEADRVQRFDRTNEMGQALNLQEQSDQELLEKVYQCLQQIDRLFPNQRYVELCRKIYKENKTQKEVADAWELSEGAVSRRLKTLIQRIRECLKKARIQVPEANQTQLRQRSQKGYDS